MPVSALFLCRREFVNHIALAFVAFRSWSHLKTLDHVIHLPLHQRYCAFFMRLCSGGKAGGRRVCCWEQGEHIQMVFLEGPGQGAPPLLQWASEVQSYGPVAPPMLYRTEWSKTALCRYQHIFGCFSKVPPKVHFFLIPVVWLVLNLKPQTLCASQPPRKWLTSGLENACYRP